MKLHLFRLIAATALMMLSPMALAALEETQTTFSKLVIYAFFLVVIVAAAVAYFLRLEDKRRTPLNKLFDARERIHAVGPDTLVTECASKMTSEKIGALVVMDGEKIVGIFSERDALSRVLAQGRDPARTKISEVMTPDPFCIRPTTTVGEAMRLVTTRRFRHLPVVENNRLVSVISSGDLTHWLVKDKVGEVQDLVDLAARS